MTSKRQALVQLQEETNGDYILSLIPFQYQYFFTYTAFNTSFFLEILSCIDIIPSQPKYHLMFMCTELFSMQILTFPQQHHQTQGCKKAGFFFYKKSGRPAKIG